MAEEKKASQKESRDKYRAKRKGSVQFTASAVSSRFRLKSLTAVATERGGLDNYIQVGDSYSSKEELMLRCAEVGEYLSLTLHFPRNSDVDLKAEAESFHNIPGPTPFLVYAT